MLYCCYSKLVVVVFRKVHVFVNMLKYRHVCGPSLVFYPRPIEEWISLSHDEIGQLRPSISSYLNWGVEYHPRTHVAENFFKTRYIKSIMYDDLNIQQTTNVNIQFPIYVYIAEKIRLF